MGVEKVEARLVYTKFLLIHRKQKKRVRGGMCLQVRWSEQAHR